MRLPPRAARFFFPGKLDTAAIGVKIRAMTSNRTSRLAMLTRITCAAAVACLVWFASIGDVAAGVIVVSDAAIGELASSHERPVPEPAKPVVREVELASLLNTTTNNTGGAGSPTPTFGSAAGLVAIVSEAPATSRNGLISRLSLFSRLALPSPLEDRFFRPPRLSN
jgi:hypothetical protein